MLDSVTATTTSNGYPVDNAGRVSLQFTAAGITSGIGTFTVSVSNDGGVNWVAYNRLTANYPSSTDTRLSNVVLNATGSTMVFIPAGDTFNSIRATVTSITDGTYTIMAYLN